MSQKHDLKATVDCEYTMKYKCLYNDYTKY